MDSLPLILEYMTNQMWAVEPDTLGRMVEIVDRHVAGVKLTGEQIEAAIGKRDNKAEVDDSGVGFDDATATAIIPVVGVIAKHARMVNGISQPRGTSIETLNKQLAEAVDDSQVESILLHIESPGGSIAGLMDFADDVLEASKVKPVVAFADDLACSAAYWIGSQATQFFANKSALVGSIGVYSLIIDSSKAFDKAGFKMHIVRSGANKGIGAEGVKITDKQVGVIQGIIDANFESFLAAITRGRGANGPGEKQLRKLADGRVFVAADAFDKKLIDGIATFNQVLEMDRPAMRDDFTETAGQRASVINGNIDNKEIVMDKDTKTEKVDAAAVALEAKNAERTRIAAIGSALDDDVFAEVRNKAIADDSSLIEAKAAGFDVAVKTISDNQAAHAAELAVATDKLEAIANGGSDANAQVVNDDDVKATADGDSADETAYLTLKGQLMNSGKTEGAAITEAAKRCPNSHAAWKSGQETY